MHLDNIGAGRHADAATAPGHSCEGDNPERTHAAKRETKALSVVRPSLRTSRGVARVCNRLRPGDARRPARRRSAHRSRQRPPLDDPIGFDTVAIPSRVL